MNVSEGLALAQRVANDPQSTPTQLEAALKVIQLHTTIISTSRLENFQPYKKQVEFFAMGSHKRERLYQAGNQLYGKTTAGAVEAAYHLTGQYPKWWCGFRFNRPVKGWAVGESGVWTRDQAQSRLCGDHSTAFNVGAPGWGTGFIPRDVLLGRTLAHGVQNGFDTISVRHVSGGTSYCGFRSYEQGRAKVQGASLDFVWPDEEPPLEIYGELLARIAFTKGIIWTTFTPLNGFGRVAPRFWQDDSAEAVRDRGVVKAGIRDVEGKTPDELASIVAGYEPHEREARINGEILMGEGAVWEHVNREMITIPAGKLSEIPLHWRKLWAIDFGIGHPFAAVLLAHDPDTDIIYVLHEIRVKDALPLHHVTMMRAVAAAPPVSWPHDGTHREKSNGEELFKFYKARGTQPGLNMRPTHATLPQGGYSTEAGVMDMLARMRDGRLLVWDTCSRWFEEFSSYHRKNGLIVKLNDDLMSATRIGVIDIRYAKAVPLGGAMGFQLDRPKGAPETNPFTGGLVF